MILNSFHSGEFENYDNWKLGGDVDTHRYAEPVAQRAATETLTLPPLTAEQKARAAEFIARFPDSPIRFKGV